MEERRVKRKSFMWKKARNSSPRTSIECWLSSGDKLWLILIDLCWACARWSTLRTMPGCQWRVIWQRSLVRNVISCASWNWRSTRARSTAQRNPLNWLKTWNWQWSNNMRKWLWKRPNGLKILQKSRKFLKQKMGIRSTTCSTSLCFYWVHSAKLRIVKYAKEMIRRVVHLKTSHQWMVRY